MSVRPYSYAGFTIEVDRPDPPGGFWARLAERLQPQSVILRVRLRDGLEMDNFVQKEVEYELKAEFGWTSVHHPPGQADVLLEIWVAPQAYRGMTLSYIADWIGDALERSREHTGLAHLEHGCHAP